MSMVPSRSLTPPSRRVGHSPSRRPQHREVSGREVVLERVVESSAQRLRKEYDSLTFRDSEAVEDFALRLTGMVNQLEILGDPEPANKVVARYLRAAPSRFSQVVIAMETLLDLLTLTVEEVTGRLKAVEDREPPPTMIVGGKLYLTEDEWSARLRQRGQGGNR